MLSPPPLRPTPIPVLPHALGPEPMHLPAILGPWGMPPDRVAWWALAATAVAICVACAAPDVRRRMLRETSGRAVLAALAFAAALLSLGYIAFYLRGGPRIVDATSYFLQARALAEGHFAWRVPEPTASFRGRFLLAHAADGAIAGIFPPGYPLLLSLGFALRAPFVVGPALAAAIVVATWALGRELAREAGLDARAQGTVARTSALLSVACAALRYHTADTMAHGACALAFTLAILAALRARRDRLPWFFLFAGLALGFVGATRFASALALGGVLAWLALGGRAKATSLLACALGTLPGLVLLLVAQSSVTGHALGTAQSAYYAASDGPPGCFRYGFGAGIGCLVEHGDFVRARASGGYGLVSALGVTLRRLRMHTEDIANFEPLALLVLVPLLRSTKGASKTSSTLAARACFLLVGALVLAYLPFYFDGDYPGGGARFFADALPVEHALMALGAALLARSRDEISRACAATLALSLLGFSVHAAYDHAQLRDRDGGHPMFDPDVLATRSLGARSKDGTPAPLSLVFVDTDHGFDLAHDPEVAERAADAIARGEKPTGVLVARVRNDDHDRLLFDRLGRPTTWMYHYRPDTPQTLLQAARGHETASGDLQPWSPGAPWVAGTETWRFEAENEWPPLAQSGSAWAEPIWATDTCASPSGNGRALAIHASGSGGGAVVLALPIPRAGNWRVTPSFLVEAGTVSGVTLEVLDDAGAVLASWTPKETAGSAATTRNPAKACIEPPSRTFTAATDRALRLSISAPNDATHLLALDRVVLTASSR